MKRIGIIILLCLTAITAKATSQVHDKIIIDGERWDITVSPLGFLPAQVFDDFQELLGKRNFISSANRRGFVAYWRIERRNLYLEKVEVLQTNGQMKEIDINLLKDVLEDYIHRGRIRAEWLTGKATVGKGRGPFNRENPHAPSFEETKELNIKKGKIKRR